MNRSQSIPTGLPDDVGPLVAGLIGRVLVAADAGAGVCEHWPVGLDGAAGVRVLAFGKASTAMANAAIGRLGDRVTAGAVLCPPEHVDRVGHPRVRVFAADHPLPTERNVVGAAAVEACARGADPEEDTLVLISGGGSAHLTAPRERVTLAEIRGQTERLLRSGVPIAAINAERARLDRLKGGGLRRACASRRVFVLLVSDVIGDDPAHIASAPMLDPGLPTPHVVVRRNADAVGAARAVLAEAGMSPVVISEPWVGSARAAGEALASACVSGGAAVGGGEPVVDARGSTGVGGRSLELALAAALAMPVDRDWCVVGLATDGVDANTGAAGAVLVSEMFRDPTAREMAGRALENHDSLTAAEALGGVVRTGPTGTNVNDVGLAWLR